MTVNEALRAMAGIVILITLVLSHVHHPYWLFFTAFVGLNLLQFFAEIGFDVNPSFSRILF